MATLTEFHLTIHKRYDEAKAKTSTVFRFRTTREFRAFRYEIQVAEKFDPKTQVIEFSIQGVHAPSGLMPSTGSAAREISYPDLNGSYKVRINGAKQSAGFVLDVSPNGLALAEPPPADSINVELLPDVEYIYA